VDTPCNWGCLGSVPHCGSILPAGGSLMAGDIIQANLADVMFQGSIDNNSGAMSGTILRSAGKGVLAGVGYESRGNINVFSFKSLHITGLTTLAGSQPIALVADGDIVISGVVDLRA